MFDYLIVGAGFAGALLRAAGKSSQQENVIVDTRSHIGGNAYDHFMTRQASSSTSTVPIFHTNSREDLQYLSPSSMAVLQRTCQ